jgi:hypothetical protein
MYRTLFLTLLATSSATAGPLGADDFDDVSTGFYSGAPLARAWGTLDTFEWFSASSVGYLVSPLPSSGNAIGTLGAAHVLTFDEPVNHVAVDMVGDLSQGCEGWGYYDAAGGYFAAGQDLVFVEAFDASGTRIHAGTYDFAFDYGAPVEETARARVRYTHPTADIASVWVHWAGPCQLYLDDLSYGKPAVDLVGTCPGPMDVVFSNFTPGTAIEVYTARDGGDATLPVGPCAGIETELDSSARLRTVLTADGNGDLTVSRNFRPAACGLTMTAVDLSICETSGADLLP